MHDDLGQNQIQAGNKKNHPNNQGNESKKSILPSEISAEPRTPSPLPHSISDTSNTTSKADKPTPHPPNWCEKWTLWLEVAGVLGLAFYCWVNWCEWQTFDSERVTMENEFQASQNSAETQLAEMRRVRNLDERAWVLVTGYASETLSDNNSGSVFNFNYRNTGKTPAETSAKGRLSDRF